MRWRPVAIGTIAVSTTLALLPTMPALAAGSSSGAGLTTAQFAALTVDQQAAILQPLRAAAGALDEVGRASGAADYGNVELDGPAGVVNLYATSQAGGAHLIAAAKRNHPSISSNLIHVKSAAYSKAALHAARDRLSASASTLPYKIISIVVAIDGSGLEVGVDNPSAVAGGAGVKMAPLAAGSAGTKDPASIAGVPVVVEQGYGMTGTTRFADTSPYYAGGYIESDGWGCTTGIPVQDNSGNYAIITASHCAHTGAVITNGNGTYEGTVSEYHEGWDAAKYPVSRSAAWEFDSGQNSYDPRQLSGTAYSYDGDWICQDGYTSAIVCNIRVVNEDAQNFRVRGDRYGNTFSVRGVIGQLVGSVPVRPGDSGGLVFAVPASGAATREVRGIVSSAVDGHSDEIFWTEALDIYNTFGVHLAS